MTQLWPDERIRSEAPLAPFWGNDFKFAIRVRDDYEKAIRHLVTEQASDLRRYEQRIAELEAEVARLRAEPTEPTLDEMILAISERKLPFVLQGWGRTWWVDYWDNRTVDQPTPSEAIRAAWEAVCKEEA